jgi:hypothetical protein
VRGDVNGDNAADAIDVQLTINGVLGLDIGSVDVDVNGDFLVNAVDVQYVINGALGLLGEFLLLGPDGGTLDITTSNGAIVTLSFPADSVLQEVEVEMIPLDSEESSWLSVQLIPAGLNLIEPVTLTVTPPADVVLTDSTTIIFGPEDAPLPLPTTRDLVAGTLSADLYTLGFVFEEKAAVYTKQDDSTNSTVSALELPCSTLLNRAEAFLTLFEASGDHIQAVAAYNAYLELATRQGCTVNMDQWVSTVNSIGCAGYTAARDAARLTLTRDLGEFETLVSPVIDWAGIALSVDELCANDFLQVLEEEVDEFLLFYEGQMATQTSARYHDLRLEARQLWLMYEGALAMGLVTQAQLILQEFLYPIHTHLRNMAYAMARSQDNSSFLRYVTRPGFSLPRPIVGQPEGSGSDGAYDFAYEDEDVFQDIQMVNSNIEVVSKDAAGAELGTLELGGGASPGQHTTDGNLAFASDGTISISGELLGLECETGDLVRRHWDDIRVEFVYGSTGSGRYETERLTIPNPGENFLSSALTIDVNQMFTSAGVVYGSTGTYSIEIYRQISDDDVCGDTLLTGPHRALLFEIDLITGSAGGIAFESATYTLTANAEVTQGDETSSLDGDNNGTENPEFGELPIIGIDSYANTNIQRENPTSFGAAVTDLEVSTISFSAVGDRVVGSVVLFATVSGMNTSSAEDIYDGSTTAVGSASLRLTISGEAVMADITLSADAQREGDEQEGQLTATAEFQGGSLIPMHLQATLNGEGERDWKPAETTTVELAPGTYTLSVSLDLTSTGEASRSAGENAQGQGRARASFRLVE